MIIYSRLIPVRPPLSLMTILQYCSSQWLYNGQFDGMLFIAAIDGSIMIRFCVSFYAVFSDPCEASMLILYKDQNHRHHKQVLPLWKFAGCLTSPKADKAENVLMIFTENTTTALAFDTPTLLNDWYQAICTQIGKGKVQIFALFTIAINCTLGASTTRWG